MAQGTRTATVSAASLRVPQLDGLVVTPRSEQFAARTEGHTAYIVGIALESSGVLPGGYIPELDELVHPPRGQRLPVWAEHHTTNARGSVPPEGSGVLTRRHIPQLHGAVSVP